jgi:uncharacterized protein
MSASPVVFYRPDPAALEEVPIHPSWIIAGAPVARAQELSRSVDGTTVTMHWSCTAGTFHWYFSIDETVLILEGAVVVRTDGGTSRTLKAGDTALFHAGSWALWHVAHSVRKIAICRDVLPPVAASILRVGKRLMGLVSPVDLKSPPAIARKHAYLHKQTLTELA